MNKYAQSLIISLVASVALSLWLKDLALHPSGFSNTGPGLMVVFLLFIVVPLFGFMLGYAKEHSLRQALLSFGIALLIAIAVALAIVRPALIAKEQERKLRCEQDNEQMRIHYETYGYPVRKDGLPFVYNPEPCN